jgi:hypothetical protein
MTALVAPIQELENRLIAELGAGNILEDIKSVYVGKRQNVDCNVDWRRFQVRNASGPISRYQ